ncbi:hypothetical protein H4Q26_009156 [Puccinia striiformis f. sp. tritici PST-130]|nr:hypothetical protein H4Q26_009156 [Puccinia striiformis f. sp. tritici PST-130]
MAGLRWARKLPLQASLRASEGGTCVKFETWPGVGELHRSTFGGDRNLQTYTHSQQSTFGIGSSVRFIHDVPVYNSCTEEVKALVARRTMAGSSPHAGVSEDPPSRSKSGFPGNRFLELKPHRDAERLRAVDQGLIPDPLKPRRLDEALPFLGTCRDMCPEFERHEREYQNNSDKWERYPGTFRIDPKKAVKAFHRPAAGNDQPLPSDVRPPDILKSTLDYLFKILLAKESLFDTHGFIRDRTRSIRQDFTLQNDRGPIAIECHERIARYHILCLHFLRDKEGVGSYQEQQELEQVRKVLQSLNEFYDDYRESNCFCPNEAEFRAYYLLTHLRDSDAARATERLPEKVFSDQRLQSALQLQILAQCGNMSRAAGRRPANSPATLNAFTRLFKKVSCPQTSFLNACLLETHFSEIRVSALKALRSAQSRKYGAHVPLVEIARLCNMSLEESFGFCTACSLTMSAGELDSCTVELHRHAPFDGNPTSTALPLAAPLFAPAFSVGPSGQKSVTVDRSVFSPIKSNPSITLSPAVHPTPLRTSQVSPKNLRSAEQGLNRERTKRSASLKSAQGSPSSLSASGPIPSSKKVPPVPIPAPSLVPPSPFAALPTRPPVVNHDKAIANLGAEILSSIVESSIAHVAQNTLLKRSMKASAESQRMTENVISHFSRNIETLVLSEVVKDVVFDLASSSLLAIHDANDNVLYFDLPFKSGRLSLHVGDISSIWNPGKLKKVVSQYLYRKVLSTYQLSIRRIQILIITPPKAPVAQAWLRCKFDIAAGQSRTQSSINEVSFCIELLDQSLDLQVITRYHLILVWQEPTEETSSFSTQLTKILQARSLRHICCLGISWQAKPINALENSGERDGLDQVELSLDTPEVQLEQALQDRWPVPLVSIALSMNNADRLLPLTHIWRGVHRKAVSLLHAYVPMNDFGVTVETKSQLKTSLMKFSVDVLKILSGHVGRMLHPPDDLLLSSVVRTLNITHLSDIQPDNVDQHLGRYQSSLPQSTFSHNLSNLFDLEPQLSLVEFFELFGQHLLAAWLDCITAYLHTSSSDGSDLDSSKPSSRALVSPQKAGTGLHEQVLLRQKLDSSFQVLQRQVIDIFPRPLSLDHSTMLESVTIKDDQNAPNVEDAVHVTRRSGRPID